MTQRLCVLLFLVCWCCTSGCMWMRRDATVAQPVAFSAYTSPEAANIRRVAVTPLYLAEDVGASGVVLSEALATALRELGYHEVIEINTTTRDALIGEDDIILRNEITADQLLAIRDAVNADAVLVGRVEHFRSYDPIQVGVIVHLISTDDGSVAWSANGHFDGARYDIQDDIQDWWWRTMGESEHELAGWRMTLQSPSLFSRYVSDRLVASVPSLP